MQSFGQRLKEVRKNARLTQTELAEKVMVSVQAISKWECGTNMPDISQIVPLAAALGVTTDYLLGAGGDARADKEQLLAEVKKMSQGIENVYSRNADVYRASCALYKDYLRKYPLDDEVRLLYADSLVRLIYYGADAAEEKDRLYDEAVGLLKSIIHCDRDTTRGIDARQMLIILYLYHNEFAKAGEVAEELPQRGNIRALMEIEIYSRRGDHEKCLEIAEGMCREAAHDHLHALAVKARHLSLLGDAGKQEAITAWRALIRCAEYHYEMLHDLKIHTKWLYSAFGSLVHDLIALSEFDRAFAAIEQLTDALIQDYSRCKEMGDEPAAAEIKGNFSFYLCSCYRGCFPDEDNIISRDHRFRKCEMLLARVE